MNCKLFNRELCAAHTATHHWLCQRLTAIALIPLSIWLLIFLKLALTASYNETLSWLTSPINALAILTWIIMVFYHAALGIQIILEDYIANISARKRLIRRCHLLFLALALAAVISIIFLFLAR